MLLCTEPITSSAAQTSEVGSAQQLDPDLIKYPANTSIPADSTQAKKAAAQAAIKEQLLQEICSAPSNSYNGGESQWSHGRTLIGSKTPQVSY